MEGIDIQKHKPLRGKPQMGHTDVNQTTHRLIQMNQTTRK